jgi:hypothetical protein
MTVFDVDSGDGVSSPTLHSTHSNSTHSTVTSTNTNTNVSVTVTSANARETREVYDSSVSRKQLRKIDMGVGGGKDIGMGKGKKGAKFENVPERLEIETSVHYTYSLGQLKVPWEELGVSAQIALCGSLTAMLPR